MADWIASGTRYFPLIDINTLTISYDPARVEMAWSRLGLQEGWTPEGGIPLDELCQERFEFSPNVLQAQVMQLVADAVQPGLLEPVHTNASTIMANKMKPAKTMSSLS